MKSQALLWSLLLLACPQLLLSAASSWSKSQRQADIVYFLPANSSTIEAYDLASSAWITPIDLGEAPSQIILDDTYIFAAFGKTLYRYAKNGSGKTHIGNFIHPILSLHDDGDLLFINHSANSNTYIESYSKSTLLNIDSFSSYYNFDTQAVLDPESNQILNATNNSGLSLIAYDDSGTFDTNLQFHTNWDYPSGARIFLWPGKERIVGTSGWVYDKQSFSEITQIAPVDAIKFVQNTLPIVISGERLIAYSRSYLETGSIGLQVANADLHVKGTTITLFYPDSTAGNGIGTRSVTFAELAVNDPDTPIDPSALAFEPEDVFATSNGKLILSHHKLSTLFTWDIETQSWGVPIDLENIPAAIRYAPETDLIYVAYANGRITKVDPAETTPVETLLIDTESAINSIVAAGSYIYTSLYNNQWQGIKIFDLEGNVTGSISGRNDTFDAVWTYRRVVSTKGNNSYLYNQVVEENGNTGTNGNHYFDGVAISSPLYPHPTDPLVITSEGILYNPQEAKIAGVLPESILGATWIDGQLFTLHDGAIKTWVLPTYAEGQSLDFNNRAHALANTPDGKLALVTISPNGQPRIAVVNTNYSIQALENLATPTAKTGKTTAAALSIEWTLVGGAQSYVVERSVGEEGPWQELATIGFDAGSYPDIAIETGKVYHYRVKAQNNETESAYSNIVSIDTTRQAQANTNPSPENISQYLRNAVTDANDILYLIFQDNKGVYRFDLISQSWLESIPTTEIPTQIVYSAQRDSLLLANSNRTIQEINLKGSPLVEVEFAKTSEYPNAMLATQDFILVIAYDYHHLYDPVGNLISSTRLDSTNDQSPILWNETKKTYLWANSWQFNETEVKRGGHLENLYYPTSNYQYPLAANPDQSLILTQNGDLLSNASYEVAYTLGSNVTDGVWVGDRLFTIKDKTLAEWDLPYYTEGNTTSTTNQTRKLLSTSDGKLVLVTAKNYGRAQVDILDLDLNIHPPAQIAAPGSLRLSEPNSNRISLTWQDVGGETEYLIQRRSGTGPWEELARPNANETTYIDSDITAGEPYSYRVKGINVDTPSVYSNELIITNATPATVANLAATKVSGANYLLSWSDAENAQAYRIEYTTNGGQYWNSYYNNIPKNQLSAQINVYSGELYQYRVASIGAYGNTSFSEPITLYENLIKPDAPEFIDAVTIDHQTIRLQWYNVSLAASYRIERKEVDGANTWSEIATLKSDQVDYLDTSLDPETRYQYRLFAINPSGTSPAKTSTIATSDKRYPPAKPDLITGQIDANSVLLNWGGNTNDATYHILRKLPAQEDWTELTIADQNARTLTDTYLQTGQTYIYTAYASNEAGNSQYANQNILTIQPRENILFEDFSNGLSSGEMTYLNGTIADSQEPGYGPYLDSVEYYSQQSTKPLSLPDGGTLTFDFRFVGLSSSATTNKLEVYYNTTNSTHLLAAIRPYGSTPSNWLRYAVTIPATSPGIVGTIILRRTESTGYQDHFQFDNISVYRALPAIPAAPHSVVAKSAPDGGVSVFWTPSLGATSYRVDVSLDDGTSWQTVFNSPEQSTYYHEASPYNQLSTYRVTAINSGGASSPTLSNAAASDIGLADAVQLGIEKVLNDPDTYQLYNSADIANAKISGHQEVVENPGAFGLFQQETISNLYFKLESQPIQIHGDLISIGWLLYRSSNLVDWTAHELSADLEGEPLSPNEAVFFKIAPNP